MFMPCKGVLPHTFLQGGCRSLLQNLHGVQDLKRGFAPNMIYKRLGPNNITLCLSTTPAALTSAHSMLRKDLAISPGLRGSSVKAFSTVVFFGALASRPARGRLGPSVVYRGLPPSHRLSFALRRCLRNALGKDRARRGRLGSAAFPIQQAEPTGHGTPNPA